MLRSTSDFLAVLRALNRPPDPRSYKRVDEPCDDCGRCPCMCSGRRAAKRRHLYHCKRRGLCIGCGRPAVDGQTKCAKCGEAANRTGKAHYERRKAAGLCTTCPARAEAGKTQCRRCLDAMAARARSAYRRRQRRRAKRA